jgi:hypothetical protein
MPGAAARQLRRRPALAKSLTTTPTAFTTATVTGSDMPRADGSGVDHLDNSGRWTGYQNEKKR